MANRKDQYIENDIELGLVVQKNKQEIDNIRSHSSTKYSDYTDEEILIHVTKKGVTKLNKDPKIQKELREKQEKLREQEEIYKYRDKIKEVRDQFEGERGKNYTDEQILKYIKEKENEKWQFLVLTCYLTVCIPILCKHLGKCCKATAKIVINLVENCIDACGACCGSDAVKDTVNSCISFIFSIKFAQILGIIGLLVGSIFAIINFREHEYVIRGNGIFLQYMEDMKDKKCNLDEVKKEYKLSENNTMYWFTFFFLGLIAQGVMMIAVLILVGFTQLEFQNYLACPAGSIQGGVWVAAFIIFFKSSSISDYFEEYEEYENSHDGFMPYFKKCDTVYEVDQVMEYGRKIVYDFSIEDVSDSTTYCMVMTVYAAIVPPLIKYVALKLSKQI